MKKFLVPVDLSHSGDNAVRIAERLSQGFDTEIHILNIVNSPSDAVLAFNGEIIEDEENDFAELKQQAVENKAALEERYGNVKNKSIEVLIGDINNIIISRLEKEEYDLLMLGMSGHHTSNFWTSSHTEYLSKVSTTPVLTLKCDRSDMSIDKIVFVSDFLTDEEINLSVLKKLSERYNSQIILLKVVLEDQQRTDEKIKEAAESFARKNELQNYDVQIYKANNVEDGIAMFCQENHIDLIAIGTHQRGGFSTLFRKSISQDIVRNLYHPIITIPMH